ncbi:MAG: hypothetical protein EZS28_012841 [Streblomastix strix]|uniref:Uncharacterized protein n=1 Tax=Streblomastix strix TaxID=222440 RepID=A0A5J4WAT2_9EUKA|nr:MAG: hypothetical protein EZS28_012841 [Streblomastix strix]
MMIFELKNSSCCNHFYNGVSSIEEKWSNEIWKEKGNLMDGKDLTDIGQYNYFLSTIIYLVRFYSSLINQLTSFLLTLRYALQDDGSKWKGKYAGNKGRYTDENQKCIIWKKCNKIKNESGFGGSNKGYAEYKHYPFFSLKQLRAILNFSFPFISRVWGTVWMIFVGLWDTMISSINW